MRARAFWLAFFRFVILILSMATLACHIANIVLLTKNQPDTGPWFPEHIPYVLYFVGPGVSLICAIALNMVSMSSVKSIRGDRSMGVLTLALMIAVIVYNTLKGGAFPWLNGEYQEGKPPSAGSGFATYCSSYNNEWSKYRCWLTDGTWLGCIIIAAFWLFLIIFVYAQKSSDIYDDDYDVYDFKEDVPMAVTSNKNESAYHASSPTSNPPQQPPSASYYNNNNQGNYQEYDSYYDYPPQSPYAGYKQPAAAGPGGYPYPGNGTGYGQDDTVHMLSDAGQPQYYSPHLNTGNAAPAAAAATPPAPSSPHVKAQTPNAY